MTQDPWPVAPTGDTSGNQPWQQPPQAPVLSASPMGVGEVFTSAFRALGRCLGLGVMISLAQFGAALLMVAVLTCGVVAVMVADGELVASPDMTATTVAAIIVASLLGVAGMVAANMKFNGMLACAVEQVARGLRPSWQSTHRATRGIVRRSIPLVGLALGATLAVAMFMVLCLAVLGDRAGVVVMVLGLLVLLVIGTYVMVRWQFTLQALAVESRGGIDALRRSFDLTRGRFWPILGTVVLIQIVPSAVSNMVTGPASRGEDATLALVFIGVNMVLSMLISLWSSAAMTVMYIDHVLRRALEERFGPGGRMPVQPWPGQQWPGTGEQPLDWPGQYPPAQPQQAPPLQDQYPQEQYGQASGQHVVPGWGAMPDAPSQPEQQAQPWTPGGSSVAQRQPGAPWPAQDVARDAGQDDGWNDEQIRPDQQIRPGQQSGQDPSDDPWRRPGAQH